MIHSTPKRSGFLTLAGLCSLTSVGAVDYSGADFGNQPIAIGAGSRALGMGGAFSAVADDATACSWNPAGLTQLERPEVAISAGWYHATVSGGNDSQTKDQIRPDQFSATLPFFAFGCQQSLGMAWMRQYDFTRSTTATSRIYTDQFGDGEYITLNSWFSTKQQTGAYSTLGLSYALELYPGLSVGMTVNAWADRLTRASHVNETITSTLITDFFYLDTSLSHNQKRIDITQDTRVVSGWNTVLGLMWQCHPDWTLAVVVKPGYRLGLETDSYQHTVDTDETGTITNVSESRAVQESDLYHPASATFGVAWRQADIHTVTLDATCTRWNQYRISDPGGDRSPVNIYLAPDEFRDLWTMRAGYEYVAILPSAVFVPRIGGVYESLPAATPSPSSSTADRASVTVDHWWGATAGFSLCQRQVIWDLGAQIMRGNEVGAGQFTSPDATVTITILTIRAGATVQF